MRELTEVVEQLKEVRLARRRFLSCWAVEQTVILPALDRVAADIGELAGLPSDWNPSDLAQGQDENFDGLHLNE